MISGEELRTARESADLTQAELGKLLGVTQRTVGNWERGEHPIPRGKTRTVEALLRGHLGFDSGLGPQSPRLPDATDAELLSEIARRFARVTPTSRINHREVGEQGGDTTATKDPSPGVTPIRRAAARGTGKVSKGQQRRRDADQAGEHNQDD